MSLRTKFDEAWWSSDLIQWIIGLLLMAAGVFLPIFYPKISSPIGVLISIAGLAIPLGTGQFKLQHKLVAARVSLESKITSSIPDIAQELYEDQYLQTLKLLTSPSIGLFKARRLFLLRKAAKRFEHRYATTFKSKSPTINEQRRTELLCDVMRFAFERVLIYTYATPESMLAFWRHHQSDKTIDRYIGIHSEVLSREGDDVSRPRIERVFVIPRDVLDAAKSTATFIDDATSQRRKAYCILVDVIERLRNCMKEDLYCLDEEQLVNEFDNSFERAISVERRGFFIADNYFVSREAASLGKNESVIGSASELDRAYAIFSAEETDISALEEHFRAAKCIKKPLSDKEFKQMQLVAKRCQGTTDADYVI